VIVWCERPLAYVLFFCYTDISMNDQAVFLGIDVSPGWHPFTYASLDREKRVLALGNGLLKDVIAYIAGLSEAVVAINAPVKPNMGLLQRTELRQQFKPTPAAGRYTDMRQAEYELHLLGVKTAHTRHDPKDCPSWMQRGFQLYQELEQMGYQPWETPGAALQHLETHAEAGFTALMGLRPFPARSLEGRLQRQLVLADQELAVPEAMKFFEEVTRYKLLHGTLPLKDIYSPAELNATFAAWITWIAIHQPGQLVKVGTVEEGVIHLPGWPGGNPVPRQLALIE
jgi:hypothetical protein